MQCTCSPLCYCPLCYNFPLCYQLLSLLLLLVSPLLLLEYTVPSVTRFFSEFPFTLYVNNHKNPFTQVQITIRRQSYQFMAYSVIRVRENPTSVQNSMSPLLLYVPSVTALSPLLLTIFFIHSLQPWRFFSSFDNAKKCSLKYGVSCFSIGYLLFASDKSVSFREA